ncbi:hypothetical protein BM536_038450 [Streptomyces phaeoluteigriseus]|uniref:NADH-ubiquinone oxidoreductase n=1 Tax=Streptomyces phaeoluteigriseus TaxID=114686 RepID=A0A1V6MH87_9ACTN|nr:hypothetical protein [Streptomyces phaeoluteigriseus]OQD51735.1 hypothetical protein BM536_038450 [Streptomyces phaeoluteigriseus]
MSNAEQTAEGAGPFTTRLTWVLADGGTAVWESRPARKRGLLSVRSAVGPEPHARRADSESIARLRRLNLLAAWAFAVGGALFGVGAGVAQFGSGDATGVWIYFAGGLFFNTGGYASLLQAINAPRRDSEAGALAARGWRWWSYEPGRIDWLSTFLLFAGTLVFGINLLSSLLEGLSTQQTNRLIWAPDLVGCILFLISGHLALVEVCHGRPGVRPTDLGWWIVAVNQLGTVLFLGSALADFTRPATGSVLNTDITNWGTLVGALCFLVGGVLQSFEHP